MDRKGVAPARRWNTRAMLSSHDVITLSRLIGEPGSTVRFAGLHAPARLRICCCTCTHEALRHLGRRSFLKSLGLAATVLATSSTLLLVAAFHGAYRTTAKPQSKIGEHTGPLGARRHGLKGLPISCGPCISADAFSSTPSWIKLRTAIPGPMTRWSHFL